MFHDRCHVSAGSDTGVGKQWEDAPAQEVTVSTDENTERCPAPRVTNGVIHPSANIRVNIDNAITVDSWGGLMLTDIQNVFIKK